MINKELFCALFLLFLFGCKHAERHVQDKKLNKVEILVLDGVNGSPVDQVELKIYQQDKLEYALTVLNGKVEVSLKIGKFYDFKLEGRKRLKPYYASSLVSSYLIDENTQHITILQLPLNKITKSTINPEVIEVKIGMKKIERWTKRSVSEIKDVVFILRSTYPCEEIKYANPAPMLALGYVPSTIDKENIQLKTIQSNKKDGQHYISIYEAHFEPIKIKNELDIVIVAYDIAYNRVEHHVRIVPDINLMDVNAIKEDESIKIENLKLKLDVYPTPSSTFAIGKDPTTKYSTHYKAKLFFDVKKEGEHIECSGIALYRKEKGEENFVIVKKIEGVSTLTKEIFDTDGMLQEGKEYIYKIIVFTKAGSKSSWENTPLVNVKVMRPSPLILTSPQHNAVIRHNEAKNLSYVFKIAESQILEDAKYMRLGFLISERSGKACYACKFKYVFNSKGEDELYFATYSDIKNITGSLVITNYSKKLSDISSKPLQDIIDVNQIDGTVTLTKDFITLPINLVATPFTYKKGISYYWDIVDWGSVDSLDVSYDDSPCHVVCDGNDEGSAEVIYYFNDKKHGSNAWNGREVFNIKY